VTHPLSKWSRFCVPALGLVAVLLLLLQWYAAPTFHAATYQITGKKLSGFRFPLVFEEQYATSVVRFNAQLGQLFPRRFLLQADDCIERIVVNGQESATLNFPLCNFPIGQIINLDTVLHSGKNSFLLEVRNDGGSGGLNLAVSNTDPLLLTLRVSTLLVLAVLGLLLVKRFAASPLIFDVSICFLLGSLARLLYYWSTPYWTRAYDWWGHIAYVRHLLEHQAIPHHLLFWESYQPPFYYAVSAIWHTLLNLLLSTTLESTTIEQQLQFLSLLLSITTLGFSLYLGLLLFSEKKERLALLSYSILVAFFPGLIYFSSRITNDTALLLLQVLLLIGLVKFWRDGSRSSWLLVSTLLGVSLLTKLSALLFVPISYLLLAFQKSLSTKEKLFLLLLSGAIIICISGWYYGLRLVAEDQHQFVSETSRLARGLQVSNNLRDYLTFHPQRILEIPYNNAWKDTARRHYVWEYLFRSALFGEFDFGERLRPTAKLLVGVAFSLLFFSFFGFVREIRDRKLSALPLHLATAFSLMALVAFRACYSYSSLQDFRHIAIIALPCSYYVGAVFCAASKRIQRFAVLLTVSFAVIVSVLLVLLFLSIPPFYAGK